MLLEVMRFYRRARALLEDKEQSPAASDTPELPPE